MRYRLAVLALAALALPAGAEVYKWVDRDGKVHYGDTPPPNARPRTLDLVPSAAVPAVPPAPEQKAQPAAQPPIQITIAPEAEPAPQPVRGMDFAVYIMLRQGMSEGELLQRAGPPDYATSDGSVGTSVINRGRRIGNQGTGPGGRSQVETFSNLELKRYYYYPTISNPFTTMITLTGGWISELQRTRQF